MPKFNSNQILSRAVKYVDRLAGVSAKKYSNAASTLKGAKSMGINGVPESAVLRASRMAKVESGRTFQSRVKAGVGAAAATGAGFLGLHKYHQHQDNKILEKIDKMYYKG